MIINADSLVLNDQQSKNYHIILKIMRIPVQTETHLIRSPRPPWRVL